jgi:NAD(P)-dependent dehydrogenase (short-subunit alcohol dehydrogenase family)
MLQTSLFFFNLAGILGGSFALTKDGFESQMAVNYLGHFLLSHLLTPQLKTGSITSGHASRIVNVSSCAHFCGKIDYDDFNCTQYYYESKAYGDSKLAQVMSAKYLNKFFSEKQINVQVFSCHPGIVNTDIFTNSAIGSLSLIRKLLFKVEKVEIISFFLYII